MPQRMWLRNDLWVWHTKTSSNMHRHTAECLATMAYIYAARTVHVTILSSGGKFPTVSNFTELQPQTQMPVPTHPNSMYSAMPRHGSPAVRPQCRVMLLTRHIWADLKSKVKLL